MSFRFRKFPVYKEIREFIKLIFIITSKFPPKYQYDLGSQMRGASISILLNLAEGSGRNSDREFNRFLMIALGSIDEVVAGLDIALDNYFITPKIHLQIIEKAESIANQLGGFSKKLKSSVVSCKS